MKNPLYFASSGKIWSAIDWIYGIEDKGYDGWEISAEGNYRLDILESKNRIAETLGSTNLSVSVHAPFSDLNLASLNYPIYRESVRQLQECVVNAADFTDRVTIHPGYMSPAAKLLPGKVWDLHKEALTEIGKTASDCGVLVCLENMPDIPDFLCRFPDEIFGMAEGIEGIGITLDCGHANTTGTLDRFLKYLSSVSHMHIHDNNGKSDEHKAVGYGTIKWDNVFSAIKRSDYKGICVVEGRNIDEAEKSLEFIRRNAL
jgi:sugar phosphate isomerase/epimerase